MSNYKCGELCPIQETCDNRSNGRTEFGSQTCKNNLFMAQQTIELCHIMLQDGGDKQSIGDDYDEISKSLASQLEIAEGGK